MKTLIVVPMKDPDLSKTRLSDRLSDAARARLARLLFRRTLAFLKPIAVTAEVDIAVVTGSAVSARIARADGITVIDEPPGCALSGAVAAAADWACARGFDRMCVIPADLAAPLATDLLRFLDSRASVTICPSEDRGTNALLVAPPNAIGFRYGPNSSRAHFDAAEQAGLRPVVMPLESLSFDVDCSACLQRAIQMTPEIRAACR